MPDKQPRVKAAKRLKPWVRDMVYIKP